LSQQKQTSGQAFGAFSFKEKAGKDKYLWLLESGNSLKAIVLRPKNIL
jgi:hypothetical protein